MVKNNDTSQTRKKGLQQKAGSTVHNAEVKCSQEHVSTATSICFVNCLGNHFIKFGVAWTGDMRDS